MASFSFNLNGVLNNLPGTLSKAKNAISRKFKSSNEGKRNPHAPSDNDYDESGSTKNSSSSNRLDSSSSSSSNTTKPKLANNSKPRVKKPKVETKYCDKCLKDEEEKVPATHHCAGCNMNYCEAHLNLHNSANKTKGHTESGQVSALASATVPLTLLPDLQQVCVLPNNDCPFACAIDPGYGSLFVVDGDMFLEYDLTTKTLVNNFKEPQERRPHKLCYDPNDDTLIFTLDRCGAHDIVKMSRDGKMIHWQLDDQSPIHDMSVDRVDGTIYSVQYDGIVFVKDGKVTNVLRENINGNNMFGDSVCGVTTNHENNLVVATTSYIITCNKKGKIFSKVDKVSCGATKRIHVDPSGEHIYFIGDSGIESTKLDGTCRTEFRNKGDSANSFDVSRGEGIDMAIDFTSGEVYVANPRVSKVQVFK